ncbi:MAG: RNA-directed DNA polymerase [Oscillospiraceae bacterium]|nr:RNA-directed DNA polymerase [Oscillospiraceae bacterium]
MEWDPRREKLSLSERDLKIMKDCGMTPAEILRAVESRGRIVPLWSVLSFFMLYETSESPKAFWRTYRQGETAARYRDCLYHDRKIPKRCGGVRTIAMPMWPLAQMQTCIAEKILQHIMPDDHACAYRRGMSVSDCAEPHRKKRIVIHLDIRDFFGTIREDMVFDALLRETGYSKKLVRFLSRLCCYQDRLPQGACTSPALSNLVFKPCDEAIGGFAASLGMDYTRYSDDLYLSTSGEVDTGLVIETVRKILADHGFRLHNEKTKIMGRQQRQSVVGIVVNEKLRPSRTYVRTVLKDVYYVSRFGAGSNQVAAFGDYYSYLRQLQGRVNYVRCFMPEDRAVLEAVQTVRSLIGAYHRTLLDAVTALEAQCRDGYVVVFSENYYRPLVKLKEQLAVVRRFLPRDYRFHDAEERVYAMLGEELY